LLIQGAVKPQFFAQAAEFLDIDVATLIAAQDQEGDIPWHNLHEQENHQRCPE
jgi:hypothetical protein